MLRHARAGQDLKSTSKATTAAAAAWTEGLRLERAGDFSRAVEHFDRCVGIAGLDQADVQFHRGWCLESEGTDPVAARTAYERAAALAVGACAALRFNASFRAGLIAIHCGDFDPAAASLRSALEHAADAAAAPDAALQATYWLAVACEGGGGFLDALDHYQKVARDDAGVLCFEARYRRLLCLVAVGSLAAAIGCAEELIGRAAAESAPRIAQLKQLAADELRQLRDCIAQA